MNEEKLALETLKALGAKDTTSPSQTKEVQLVLHYRQVTVYLNTKQVISEKIY